MYKVIKYIVDLQDGNHAYNVGDTFPRAGHEVSPDRINELSGSKNKQGVPLIKLVEPEESKAPEKRTTAKKTTAKKAEDK